jgi:uncharacterized membrane protein YccC
MDGKKNGEPKTSVSGSNHNMIGEVHGDYYNGVSETPKQEMHLKEMLRIIIDELHRFYESSSIVDAYVKSQTEYLYQIISISHQRNEKNLERLDTLFEQHEAMMRHQSDLINLLDRQNQKMNERADRILAILEKKL